MADNLFHQRRLRNNNPAWAWNWANTLPELYGSQVPVSITDTILPDRAPGRPRAAPSAYQIPCFTVELYAIQTPAEFQTRLVPDRAPGRPRAGRRAYQVDTNQVDLYAPPPVIEASELLAIRQLTIPSLASGRPRAGRDAYAIGPSLVDIYGNSPPPGKVLFPDRQVAVQRPLYPDRRARRKAFPGAAPEAPQTDFPELIPGRLLLPDRAPGPRRADRTSYFIPDNPARLYAPAPVTQFEELFGSRQLLPLRAPGARRSTADSYDLQPTLVDLYAPTAIPPSNELFANLGRFPDRVAPARRRFRRKIYPGGSREIAQAEHLAGRQLLPQRAPGQPRAASRAYRVDAYQVELFGIEAPQHITHILLPERVSMRPRAARDAYVIAPSLVELYAAQIPVEIARFLMPNRAPGRPRAGRSAYALENNNPEFYAPPFVPSAAKPTRLLLGVGL